MLTFIPFIGLLATAQGAPGPGHFAYGNQQIHCHTLYNVKIEQDCHNEFDQECHEEFDTIVDTNYIQDCQDIVTHHCEQISTRVQHTSAIVGQESYLASEGHGYQKRESEARPGYEYTSEPQCHAKKNTQCQKKPVQTSRQIPRQVCVPVPRQVCVPYEVKIPYNTCGDSNVYVEQYTNDLVYGY